MKKLLILFNLLCVLLCSFATFKHVENADSKNSYSIKLDDAFSVSENEYSVGGIFNFTVEAEKPVKGVHIILSREKLQLHDYIGKEADETPFSAGNMIITDRTEPRILYFNSDLINNYLSPKENTESTNFSVKIKGFAETDDSNPIDKLFCFGFCDLNKNGIIEQDELKQIIINVNPAFSLTDEKIYVSTVGYRVKTYSKIEDTYVIYKINSFVGFNKFKATVTPQVSNFDMLFENESQFKNVNYYIVHSPVTTNKFLAQPYKYARSNILIFDVMEDTKNSSTNYIAARNYQVKKTKDILRICINISGKIIFPEIIEY